RGCCVCRSCKLRLTRGALILLNNSSHAPGSSRVRQHAAFFWKHSTLSNNCYATIMSEPCMKAMYFASILLLMPAQGFSADEALSKNCDNIATIAALAIQKKNDGVDFITFSQS